MNEKPVPEISIAAQPYWKAAAAGQLLIQHCLACGSYIHYPRQWCPACLKTDLEWIEACGRGTVHTYTIIHASSHVSYEQELPYILAVVELEEGPRIMSNLVNCPAGMAAIGMAVNVCFEKRGGSLYVPQFTPASNT